MNRFRLSDTPIDGRLEHCALGATAAGACVVFEGWVRDRNDGRSVHRLDYQAYVALAESEGEAILAEAVRRFGLAAAAAAHRTGTLAVGDLAVWVGVSAGHRGEAFEACRWIIDAIKQRVPIWKNEHYTDGNSGWLHPDGTPAVQR